MVREMDPHQLRSIKRTLGQLQLPGRFRPLITTNGIAEKCIAGEQWPEETDNLQKAPCPLLAQDMCSVYDHRPFGCRCLLSTRDCSTTGHAEMDPWLLTLNYVVLQVIEHLDCRGYTGNLIDILPFMIDIENHQSYARNEPVDPVPELISNRPLKMLLLPPEHRKKIQPFLREIQPLLAEIREP